MLVKTKLHFRFGDIEGVLERLQGSSTDIMAGAPGLNFIITLGLYKTLLPMRMSLTGVGTWSIVRYYRCRKQKKMEKLAAMGQYHQQ